MYRIVRHILLSVLLSLGCEVTCAAVDIPWQEAGIWTESAQARAIRQVLMPTPALTTGACEYSVPLYTLSVGDAVLPLTLQYRTNGIRVDDDPQPIGYGWILTPTLRVTRQIYGRPDEKFASGKDKAKDDYIANFRSVTTDSRALNDASLDSAERYDSEHDIYTVYLPERTLTLIRERDTGKFRGVACDEYTVEADSRLSYIKVTNPYGHIYDFSTAGEYTDTPVNRTEWLLTTLTQPSGETIHFSWLPFEHTAHGQSSIGPKSISYNAQAPTYIIESTPEASVATKGHNTFGTKNLSRIEFPGGSIRIEYESYSGEKMMKALKVYSAGNCVHSAILGRGTRNSARLLESVRISGEGTYSFEYNPHRFSSETAQDWWGYYNGKDNNAVLSPTVRIKRANGELDFPQEYTIEGADRTTDTTAMRANILERVILPAGGHIEWSYEPHHFAYKPTSGGIADEIVEPELTCGGGLRVKSITLRTDSADATPRVRHYIYGENASGQADVTALPTLGTFVEKCNVLENRPTLRISQMLTVNRQSSYMSDNIGEPSIWYSRVEEIEEEGKSVYLFGMAGTSSGKHRDIEAHYPTLVTKAFSQGPQPIAVERYKKGTAGYSLVEKTTNTYSVVNNGSAVSRRINRRLVVFGFDTSPDFGEPLTRMIEFAPIPNNPEDGTPAYAVRDQYNWFDVHDYRIELIGEQLSSTTAIQYTATGEIERTQTYTYLPGTSLIQSVTSGDGSTSATITNIYAVSPKNGNNVGNSEHVQPQAVEAGAKGLLISSIETVSGNTCGYSRNIEMRGRMPLTASITLHRDTTSWTPVRYSYNDMGRLISRVGADGVRTCLTWDAIGRYPLTQTIDNDTHSGVALVSIAEWIALVGLSSLQKPNGSIISYAYDEEGRLAEERLNGRLLKRYAYRISQDGTSGISTQTFTTAVASHRFISRADGLGRIFATFSQTPDGYIATATDFDRMGRERRLYRPTPTDDVSDMENETSDAIVSSIASAGTAYYSDSHTYTQTEYEASPRHYAIAVTKAGDAWHSAGKQSRRHLFANDDSRTYRCPRYVITPDGVRADGYYAPGQITVEESIDEDGVTVRTFTDFRGQMVRKVIATAATDYVYDNFGELRYILPPGLDGTHSRNEAIMQQLAYWYDYDSRGNLISKKIPGAEAVRYLYDPADRMVAERDGRLSDGVWNLYVYDHLGRQVAKYSGGMTEDEIIEYASACRTATLMTGPAGDSEYDYGGYALSPAPMTFSGNVLWAKYYDDYRYKNVRGLGNKYDYTASNTGTFGGIDTSADVEEISSPSSAVGLLTGLYTGSGYEAYYYDAAGREIQRYATGYNRGRRNTYYNYSGSISAQAYTYPDNRYLPDMVKTYTYDNCGRLVSTSVSVADTSSVAKTATLYREYNAVGQLVRMRHGSAAVTEYAYDVHGWLTSQSTSTGSNAGNINNNDAIGYTLSYAPCYNGNVASRTWSEGTYRYSYDTMNRLTAAHFVPTEEASARPGVEQTLTPDFSTYYGYDERCNITDVVRHGVTDMMDDIDCIETFGTLDEIVCTYEGNQLRSMTAMSEALPFNGITGLHANGDYEMTYNAAGDLVRDPSRGVLRTQWNADGHPSQYDLEGGHRHRLGWDNTGNHLYTSYETSVTTVSAGQLAGRTRRTALRAYTGDGHVLCGGEGNSIADSIEMIRFDGGYFDADLVPHYYIADYLDSNIAVIDADGDLVQTATYYPYGDPHRNPLIRRGIDVSAPPTADAATAAEPRTTNLTQNEMRTANPYLYGDKEWMYQDGLREYVYGARMHVPSLPRFTSIDPLAEKHPEQTPYLFCGANPIRFVDPSGLDVYTVDSLGNVVEHEVTKEYDKIVMQEDANKSVLLKYGTIEKFQILNWIKDGSWAVFTIRGDSKATEVFEFLANNTKVEWSQLMLGQKGDKGLNIVSTSNDKTNNKSGPYLIFYQYQNGYSIRQDIHSHPDNTGTDPSKVSGLNADGTLQDSGDVPHATANWNLSLRMKERIVYKIFNVQSKKYIDFYPYHYYKK